VNEKSFINQFKEKEKLKKISKAIISMTVLALMAFAAFAAVPAHATTALLNPGTLDVEGSSTVYPISVAAQPGFEAYTATLSSPFQATNVILNNQGSGGGIQAWEIGSIDMAASSKTGAAGGIFGATYPVTLATGTSVVSNPQEFAIGQDSVAIIVPASDTWLTQASASEIDALFTVTTNGGTQQVYATWGDWATAYGITLPAGVSGQQILHIGREFSSGTFDGFNTFFLKPFGNDMTYSASTGTTAGLWTTPDYVQETSNQAVLAAITNPSNAYAIGFIGLGFVQNDLGTGTHPDGINAINLYNPTSSTYVVPTIANVLNGSYVSNEPSGPVVIVRWLWYFMDGIPSATSSAAVKSLWISYVKSDPTFLTDNGYILMNRADMAGASASNPNTSVGTQTVPDGKVDYNDITYFVSAYILYNGPQHLLNPYADFNADGKVDYSDITAFVSDYIAANSA
jgi:ABC-type phosphate transport system substrate-binding protein